MVFLFMLNGASAQIQLSKELRKDDFSIMYPSHMEMDENGEGSIFVLKTQTVGEDDRFIENINLATQTTDMQLDEFAEITKKQIGQMATIVESNILKVNGEDCLRLIFRLPQNGLELTFMQHLYVKDGKIYALTFSSEATEFEHYYEEMNEVMMSFKFSH